ncbi:hypothetical protein J7889_02470 [Mycoplasmopsis agalactiae]|nr:hypothetical protein [Mycoplasmopsis agalactiae]
MVQVHSFAPFHLSDQNGFAIFLFACLFIYLKMIIFINMDTNVKLINNIFSNNLIKPILGCEKFYDIAQLGNCKIELIYSNSASTDWLINAQTDELAILIQGYASLLDDSHKKINMQAGDCLFIKKNSKHKILSTSGDAIWISIHFKEQNEQKS